MPTPDLSGDIPRPAVYIEAAAASRALADRLKDPRGDSLLFMGGGSFWTGHSERNGLPSAAAALNKGRDVQEQLGRWKAEASEAYIRTTRLVAETSQTAFAMNVRNGAGMKDWLDEEAIFNNLRGYTRNLGHADHDTEAMNADGQEHESNYGCEGGDTEIATIGELPPNEVQSTENLGGYVVSEVGRTCRFRPMAMWTCSRC